MKLQWSIIFLFFLTLTKTGTAQSFEGIWKGTSLCQVKNSPCHDEIVVYHISKDSSGKSYEMIANKIVEGKEEYMGTLLFSYDTLKKSYVSIDKVRNAIWEFKITGHEMKGTLVYKNNLYRIIEVKKEK
jgi:hypothetical protein